MRAISAALPESLGWNHTCAARGASSPCADHRQRSILHEGADMQFLRQCSPHTERRNHSVINIPATPATRGKQEPLQVDSMPAYRPLMPGHHPRYQPHQKEQRASVSECKRLTVTFKGWSFRPMTLPQALGAGASSTCATSSIG